MFHPLPRKKGRPEKADVHGCYGRLLVVAACCGALFFASSRSRGDGGNCAALDDPTHRTSDRKYSPPYRLKMSFASLSMGRVTGIVIAVDECPSRSDNWTTEASFRPRATVYWPAGNT